MRIRKPLYLNMKPFLCILFVCLHFLSFAQQDSSAAAKTPTIANLRDTSYIRENPVKEFMSIDFNLGLSIPTGNFASGDYTNPYAGYAKEGYGITTNVMIKVVKQLNIILSYSRQMNVFDSQSFEVNALKGVKNYTLDATGNWRNQFILGGVSGNIALDESNFLTPRILVGLCLTKTPAYNTHPVAGTSTVTPTFVESQGYVNFAMRIGVGLKKNLTQQLFATISPDFYYTKLKNSIDTSSPNSGTPQSISIICVSVGVGLLLYK